MCRPGTGGRWPGIKTDKPTSKLLSADKERIVYDDFVTKELYWLD